MGRFHGDVDRFGSRAVAKDGPMPAIRATCVIRTAALFALTLGVSGPCDAEATTFGDYTPLSSNLEMARRMLTPLSYDQIPARLSGMGKALKDQAIDLKAENFSIFVPKTMPPAGYGLLVFIPPWNHGGVPAGWASACDRLGIILVSALRSGNDEGVLGRRVPLAILAAYNVTQRYRIAPSRAYISGFSGGSRVAMRVALAYPDLFTGAFLDAGSDPIGRPEVPLPPRPLFDTFRRSTVVVYASGALDDIPQSEDAESLGSMQKWCVAHAKSETIPLLRHDPVPPNILTSALTTLDTNVRRETDASSACWHRITADVDRRLDGVSAAIQSNDIDSARRQLRTIDARYGGLASPKIDDLARAMAAPSSSSATDPIGAPR